MLERVRRILAESGAELSREELLDALWLARRLPPGAASELARATGPVPAGPAPVADAGPVREPESPPGPGGETAGEAPGDGGLHAAPAPAAPAPGAAAVRPAVPVRTRQGRALGGAELGLGRALRPLKQLRADRRTWVLDEDATVRAMAESGLPDAVLRPVRTRWLDLVLLVDDGVSMLLWQRLVVETRLLMERSGAFRDVRVYGLDSRGARAPRLHRRPFEPDGSELAPRTVTDPSGRTLVLVVSDGVGSAWHDGRMRRMLRAAGGLGPVAVLHALPPRLWDGSGIRARTWRVTTRRRGAPNRTWQVNDPVLPAGLVSYGDEVPVPVLAPHPRSLAAWAALVGSPGASATLPLLSDHPVPLAAPARKAPEEDGGLLRFRDAASPQAYRLATHLAALAPVSVPAMRLVTEALDPDVDTGHLAEVFLGGLMRGVSDPALLPQHRAYDFPEEARRILLASAPAHELTRAARRVTERLAELGDGSPEFPAWLEHAAGREAVGGGGAPFGWVGERVLRRVGVAVPPVGKPGAVDGGGTPARDALPVEGGEAPVDGGPVYALGPDDPRRLGPYEILHAFLPRDPSAPLYLGRSERDGYATVRTGRADVLEHEADVLRRLQGLAVPRPLDHGVGEDGVAWSSATAGPDLGSPDLAAHARASDGLEQDAFRTLGAQLAGVVAGAHSRGVTHGMLAAETVLVADGSVHVVGWFRARVHDGGDAAAQSAGESADVVDLCRLLWDVAARGRIPERVGAMLTAVLSGGTGSSVPGAGELAAALAPPPGPRPALLTEPGPMGGPFLALDIGRREYGGWGPHGQVVAAREAGRRALLVQVARALTLANPPGALRLMCLDLAGSWLFEELSGLPQVDHRATNLAQDKNASRRTAELLAEELRHREEVLESTGQADIETYERAVLNGRGLRRLPRLAVLVHGYELRRRARAARLAEAIDSLAHRGGRLGVHLLVSLPPDETAPRVFTYTVGLAPDGRGTTLEHHGDAPARTVAPRGATGPVPVRAAPWRPYFFLSHAVPGRTEDEEHSRELLATFYGDLCAEVTAMTGAPAGSVVGFMDEGSGTASHWGDRRREALENCRVFVPLVSPRYFTSDWCGGEWWAFTRRALLHETATGRSARVVVPVPWIPVRPERVPSVAAGVQWQRLGGDDADPGLYELTRLRDQRYWLTVSGLARRIVTAAEAVDLPPGPATDTGALPGFFRDTRPTIEVGVRVVVSALRVAQSPGSDPPAWNAYPEAKGGLALVVERVVRALGHRAFAVPPDSLADYGTPRIVVMDHLALAEAVSLDRLDAPDGLLDPQVGVLVVHEPGATALPESSAREALARLVPGHTGPVRVARTLTEYVQELASLVVETVLAHSGPDDPEGRARPRLAP
ncbi:TIR-like protein FxsC [Streptomyces sp. NPDC001941]|uniref:TIR-like protein FxsC n=1 Tax=Streptomyces sp. NPDC001941 TaxID=3154659 RepID=UPI003321391F